MITDDLERIAVCIVRVKEIQVDSYMYRDTLQSILGVRLCHIQKQAGYTNCLLSLLRFTAVSMFGICRTCNTEHPDS
jgi:hypothetical protein